MMWACARDGISDYQERNDKEPTEQKKTGSSSTCLDEWNNRNNDEGRIARMNIETVEINWNMSFGYGEITGSLFLLIL